MADKITPDFSEVKEYPATQAQKDLLDKLDVWYHSGISKREASKKIDEALAEKRVEEDQVSGMSGDDFRSDY